MGFLEARGVGKSFSRDNAQVHALQDFDLDLQEGEFVSIVGPSGCGKSTFLHMVGGFETLSSGSIRLAGAEITGPGPDRGMLFQDYALFPWRTVAGNVGWSLEIRRVPRAQRERTVQQYLEMVGLTQFHAAYPAELSGGMQQRVALARVLACEPRMLLMDEPFGALDAQTRELMQEELLEIWQRSRRTVLFVTHDIDEAVYLSDRVVVFTARPGSIKADLRLDLPRPRRAEVRKSPAFTHYRNLVWDLLREEVLKAKQAP